MSNPVFGNYARYYNLLYQDKDYASEARYINALIQKHRPGAGTVLNLGCGTGNHDFELAGLGYAITGVDMSAEMLSAANTRLSSIGSSIPSVCFKEGDIRTVRLHKTFDIVLSLFHVMSYLSTNDDLQSAVATIKEHLVPGGLLIFDCWYGPAVLRDPPVVRVKHLEDAAIQVVRIAEPVMHPNDNLVDVNYHVIITDKSTGKVEQLKESHRMRYLFIPELELVLHGAGLNIISVSEWMTDNLPGFSTWGICLVVQG